ncbi:MAG: domain containing protein [Acidimicrobiales bacterium]|jgi:hypothetical protein|nr:domain containing protein [Acidimicrobiales bacterium]
MSDMWAYRTIDRDRPGEADLTGIKVVSSDGHQAGRVVETVRERGSGWIVIDTGRWIVGRKRLVPAGAIGAIDLEHRTVQLIMTKDEIKRATDDEDRRDETYVGQVAGYFGPMLGGF